MPASLAYRCAVRRDPRPLMLRLPSPPSGPLCTPRTRACCSIKDRFGPAHSLPLYCAYFLATTVNCAWLMAATSVQVGRRASPGRQGLLK